MSDLSPAWLSSASSCFTSSAETVFSSSVLFSASALAGTSSSVLVSSLISSVLIGSLGLASVSSFESSFLESDSSFLHLLAAISPWKASLLVCLAISAAEIFSILTKGPMGSIGSGSWKTYGSSCSFFVGVLDLRDLMMVLQCSLFFSSSFSGSALGFLLFPSLFVRFGVSGLTSEASLTGGFTGFL